MTSGSLTLKSIFVDEAVAPFFSIDAIVASGAVVRCVIAMWEKPSAGRLAAIPAASPDAAPVTSARRCAPTDGSYIEYVYDPSTEAPFGATD